MADPCALAALPFRHLATGDPQAVPAGIYAKKWMQNVRCDGKPLWDAVQDRIAPTPDVRSAIALVAADPDVAGLVYRTDQLAFADRTRVLYEVKEGPPIRYAVALVAGGANAEAARGFLAFVSGQDAAQVFARRGFIPMANQTAAAP
jgi:molybdate transport system substrate-binding protein